MGTITSKTGSLRISLKASHAIGRTSDRDLCLPFREVSSTHAAFRWNVDHWEIMDLRSTNGTLLNGDRIAPGEWVELSEGDQISFGHPEITYSLVDASPPTP